MKSKLVPSFLFIMVTVACAYDWDGVVVPADPGIGNEWQLRSAVSDDFNYVAAASDKSEIFNQKWYDSYHNEWTGPGLTEWRPDHSCVADGKLEIGASRKPGTNQVYTGCITSRHRVQYPVFVETRARLNHLVLASDVWMLSPDDTQEIDILEAYGSAGTNQDWFAERLHLSHHVFEREPFQDYQPKDEGSWFYNGTVWRDDWVRIGVYWKDPWNLEYYVNGELVRTVSGPEIIDPHNYTKGTGLSKAMDIIINVEDQDWRSEMGLTPTDEELADPALNTMYVDWIRVYKPVESTQVAQAK